MDKKLLIPKEMIQKKVKELAEHIDRDFKDEEITIICVLKGAFIFTSDLVRLIKNLKCNIEFLKISSYGSNTVSSGIVTLPKYTHIKNIANKNVIIVEDILDTGLTLKTLVEFLKKMNPKSLKTCVLLNKKERRKVEFEADYVGFEIEDKFVIGYGLDYDERFRQLPEIYYITNHG